MASSKTLAELPAELCRYLVSVFMAEEADLIFLWTSMRHVSIFWRTIVDDFVRQKHLPATYIIAQTCTISPQIHPSLHEG